MITISSYRFGLNSIHSEISCCTSIKDAFEIYWLLRHEPEKTKRIILTHANGNRVNIRKGGGMAYCKKDDPDVFYYDKDGEELAEETFKSRRQSP